MRVLHFLKTSTGASWALKQIRELVKLRAKVHVVLPPKGKMVGRYKGVGAIEHYMQTDFPIKAPWRIPRLLSEIRKITKMVKPDIVHSHFVGTTLGVRTALRRINNLPRIFQVPGPLHLEHALVRDAEIACADSNDFWIGSCLWTCNRYRKSNIPPEKIFLSYYGTDTDIFVPASPGKLRNELGISKDCKIVGTVAYMYGPKYALGQKRGIKGHEDLIDAFYECLKNYPNMRCVFVGGAWNDAKRYESFIRRYANRKCGNKVIFLGNRNDIQNIYADFDVAVHPSHSENVGGAVESLLLGVPTITTNVGGFPDLVKDGKTGLLVQAKNTKALSRAILWTLNNPEASKNMASLGQKITKYIFDVKRTSKEIYEIYNCILDRYT